MASTFSLYIPIFMAYAASILGFSFASYPANFFPPLVVSSIAAAPEFSPEPSPAPPPDIFPVFPTPGSGDLPPSSLPTIPSSPSPPNPDFTVSTAAPEMPLPPSLSLPFSAAASLEYGRVFWLGSVAVTAAFAAELCR